MLKDRRVLIEKELKKAHDSAAAMYMDIIRNDGNALSPLYQELKERIADLTFDLKVVNSLIDKGQE